MSHYFLYYVGQNRLRVVICKQQKRQLSSTSTQLLYKNRPHIVVGVKSGARLPALRWQAQSKQIKQSAALSLNVSSCF